MRPRKTDRHLPACIYLRSGSYWLVKNGKWLKLARNLPDALKAYAKTNIAPTEKTPALLDRYMASLDISPNTRKSYGSAKNHLAAMFVEFEPHQITVQDVLAMQHHFRNHPGTANTMRTVLIGALDLAIIEGYVDRNLARDTRPLRTIPRDRYITDEEYSKLYAQAREMMQIVMDLCYLTGQRIGDILSIRYADLLPEGIAFTQGKTKHRMIVGWTADLKAVVERAKSYHQSVKGMTLLHSNDGKPYRYERIRDQWETIVKNSGVSDAHIHDLRAKAGTDAKAQGMDSKGLLGHTTDGSHQRYLRNRDTPITSGLSFRKAS